ncbi:hypothetical protein AtEden1_Chr1g0034741 [Arabidopsis thaliana]
MASSIVSSMFLFLLLLLVFPHIDNVLGARMGLRELGLFRVLSYICMCKPFDWYWCRRDKSC